MEIFYITLVAVYICALFARYLSKPSSLEPTYLSPNKYFTFVAMIALVLVSGLRSNIGDTYVYKELYVNSKFKWDGILNEKDFGFTILQMLLRTISEDPQILIFTTALITNVIVVLVLYKYSRLFEIALFVYIASGMYVVTMNGVRQYLAASLIFAATKYIFDGSFIKYSLVVVLASTIHQSALILIPVYFIVRRKAWTLTTFGLLAVTIFATFGYNYFSELLFATIEDTQYGNYKEFSQGGANVIRVAVSFIPLVLAYMGRDKFREIFPKSDYIVNLSILSLLFMIIATQNWIFARFSIYFGIYEVILLSWVVKLFHDKDQKIVYYGIVACYFVYFIYEYVVAQGIYYRSSYINF